MPEEPIFRREALEAYAGYRRSGGVLRLSPRWIGLAYWLAIAAVASTVAYLWIARTPAFATGSAYARDGALFVAFPARHRDRLRAGAAIHVELGAWKVERAIESIVDATADVVIVRATGPVPNGLEGLQGNARVRIGTVRLVDVLGGDDG